MVSIVQQPPEVAPVYSDIVMTVVSDKIITNFKNKYVFDVFTNLQNGTVGPNGNVEYVGRIKSTPNPSGYGMLDLSRYLQNIVTPDITVGTPNIESKNTVNTRIVNSASGYYYVACGEEYSDTEEGPVTLYNGNDTVSSGTTLTSTLSTIMFMFNGVNQFEDGYEWPATSFFLPTGRTFLTDSPRTLYKETDEYIQLGALSGLYSGTSTQGNLNLPMRASVFNSSGSLIKTFVGTNQVAISSNNKNMNLVIGYIEHIVSGFTGTWNRIDLFLGTLTGATTGSTETLTVFKKICPVKKYNPVDIMFLNRYGAWDNFRFFGSKDEDIKIGRKTYQRQYGTWSGINFGYNTTERGTSNIQTDLTLQGEIMSDFLEQDMVNWLEELLTSPEVFIIGEFNTNGTTRKLIPINITDSNFKRQLKGNRKLRQVSFKYEHSNQIRTQQQGL